MNFAIEPKQKFTYTKPLRIVWVCMCVCEKVIKNWMNFAILQRLRNENRLLKKQNELLEAESTELAHRLVRGQVSRAEEEETAFAIESELLALRKSHVEISHQLETANEEIRGLSLRLQENVSTPHLLLSIANRIFNLNS